jgi:hypothetical protein
MARPVAMVRSSASVSDTKPTPRSVSAQGQHQVGHFLTRAVQQLDHDVDLTAPRGCQQRLA